MDVRTLCKHMLSVAFDRLCACPLLSFFGKQWASEVCCGLIDKDSSSTMIRQQTPLSTVALRPYDSICDCCFLVVCSAGEAKASHRVSELPESKNENTASKVRS